MHTKLFVLVLAMALTATCMVNAQSPMESPSPAKKHRASKKAAATVSPTENPASPAVGESPVASPKPKRGRKKTEAAAAATPVVSPAASASPGKFGGLFKPKSSVSASPSAAPAIAATTTATPAAGGGHGLVWVNTATHVYHKEGSRFYGTTKKGKYVSEADAIKEGDRAAANSQ
jgi:hypothetical protein